MFSVLRINRNCRCWFEEVAWQSACMAVRQLMRSETASVYHRILLEGGSVMIEPADRNLLHTPTSRPPSDHRS